MIRALLTLLAALALAAAPAVAAEPRTSLPDVEDEVMCPSCNTPLNVAESPQADRQREYIRALVGQGLTKEQVKERLVAEYGDDVLALPADDGIGLAAYLVPLAVVGALAALLLLLLPSWRRRAAQPLAAAGPGASDAELRRLDEDLRSRER